LAAGIAAVVFGYVAGSAPAGNRSPAFTFKADPGPSAITFGKNVAYKASFQNTSKSNYTKVTLAQTVPSVQVTDGTTNSTLYADLVYSSCESPPYSAPVNNVYSCPTIASLPANSALQNVTLVWQSKTLPAGDTCVSSCKLATTGMLAIKEGLSNTGSNDTFSIGPVLTTLLDVPDPSKAGGYPIAKCTDPSNPTLTTNLAIGPGNPMSTKVCEPVLPTNSNGLNPGLATTLTERDALSDETNGTTQVSVVCIADVGLTCPDTPATAFTFPPDNLATFVFVYDNHVYGKISQMFDNNTLVSSDPSVDPNCQITYDNPNHLSIATCHSSTNGPWRGG